MDFKFYFSLFLRRIHWFLLFFVIGSAVGLTLARILPTVYTAQAQLLVQSEEIPANLAQSTVQTEATEQLQIIQQRILTRNTLIDMANRLEIYGAPGSPERLKMSADDAYLAENVQTIQYKYVSDTEAYFENVGDILDFEGKTKDITPEDLING